MINYYLLTKPKIVMGNIITVAAGFLLASKGHFDITLFCATLLGLALIMASSCVFNNYINRITDKEMERTKNRPLVLGLISNRNAIMFATALGVLGAVLLWVFTNPLTVFIAGIGFFVYVVLYSFWKCHTIYATAIGSIAGAVPPVIGYCAVSNRFDAGACILFAMMVLWQMPHFFSIAMYHLKDYTIAKVPVLPVLRGVERTKIHMVIYILGFILASLTLTLFGYTGYLYLIAAMAISMAWLGLCVMGFNNDDHQVWGRKMFYMSLLVINVICLVIPFDVLNLP